MKLHYEHLETNAKTKTSAQKQNDVWYFRGAEKIQSQ